MNTVVLSDEQMEILAEMIATKVVEKTKQVEDLKIRTRINRSSLDRPPVKGLSRE